MKRFVKNIRLQRHSDYKFADEEYADKFSNEKRIGDLAALMSLLAIFISCLGLVWTCFFMAEQRTKEIGVRKVLGASVFNLWRLVGERVCYSDYNFSSYRCTGS